jgi:hypothetical protein
MHGHIRRIAKATAVAVSLPLVLLACAACSSAETSEVPLPAGTPFSAELAERLHAIRDKMSQIRGLALNDNVEETLITRDALREYYKQSEAALTEEERREIEAANISLRLLHMIGPEDNVYEEFSDSDAEGILGFYVPTEDRLALIGDGSNLTPYDDWILAHEYVHSLQDGRFDLGRLEKLEKRAEEKHSVEYDTTASCLKEGDAVVASIRWGVETHGENWRDIIFGADEEDDDFEQDEADDETPPALERYMSFNYDECVDFAVALWVEGGFKTIDDAFDRVPSTTEQILHPEKYLAGEKAAQMGPVHLAKRLGDGWEEVDLGPLGEFDVLNYLWSLTDNELASRIAAAGWGAGWWSTYVRDSGGGAEDQDVLVHLAVEWDSAGDLLEFLMLYNSVIDRVSGGNKITAEDGKPVCWREGDGAVGYLSWDEALKRTDVVVSNHADALSAATASGLSSPASGSCPEF